MEKINSLVGVRERTEREVRERLAKSGFSPDEVEDAVSCALRVDLINEERFTRAFIRGKSHAGWGRIKIVQHLMQAGIGEDLINACDEEFMSFDAELRTALRILEKRQPTSSDPYSSYMRRLVGKGFSYELATRAVKTHMGRMR